MQLNIHVPKEKAQIVRALDEAAGRLGRRKNEIVLEALESYLTRHPPELGSFHLGNVRPFDREDLYLDRRR